MAAFKIELRHIAGRGADQTVADEEQHSYQLAKTIALTTVHNLANLLHITIQLNW
jgi:hypothetical protein